MIDYCLSLLYERLFYLKKYLLTEIPWEESPYTHPRTNAHTHASGMGAAGGRREGQDSDSSQSPAPAFQTSVSENSTFPPLRNFIPREMSVCFTATPQAMFPKRFNPVSTWSVDKEWWSSELHQRPPSCLQSMSFL